MPIDYEQIEPLQRFKTIAAAAISSAVTLGVAYKYGYFKICQTEEEIRNRLSLWQSLGAFLTFAITTMVFFPLACAVLFFLQKGSLTGFGVEKMDLKTLGWYNVTSLSLATVALLTYTFLLPKEAKVRVLGSSILSVFPLFKGISAWLLTVPSLLFITQILEFFLVDILHIPPQEQVAVRYVRQVMHDPLLFPLMLLVVAVIAPVTEELLFRGFLQRWLSQRFSRRKAIALSSFFFALCHFSLSQGWSNLELFTALFLFSLMLGFIFEKEESILAPIGLHMTFNALSLVGILLEVK